MRRITLATEGDHERIKAPIETLRDARRLLRAARAKVTARGWLRHQECRGRLPPCLAPLSPHRFVMCTSRRFASARPAPPRPR